MLALACVSVVCTHLSTRLGVAVAMYCLSCHVSACLILAVLQGAAGAAGAVATVTMYANENPGEGAARAEKTLALWESTLVQLRTGSQASNTVRPCASRRSCRCMHTVHQVDNA